MLEIRLRREGKTNQAYYRIVVTEHTASVRGNFNDIVGNFNPYTKETHIDKEKISKWLANGAKPTNRVAKILTSQGMKHKSIVIIKYPPRKPKSAVPAEKTVEKSTDPFPNRQNHC